MLANSTLEVLSLIASFENEYHKFNIEEDELLLLKMVVNGKYKG
jgi:hypothetical protein